ncbi:MAG: hypothetical protein KZQ99_17955 [Candidatus Thiodiazotropha sp. (ex Dulcina madagascariensis)]|nr:hypothetical protein [Candidatus Thiodiazotropha sp. (ex Dulcina madagascariensis)]
MTEYEIIDAVCDSVNPILFLTAVGLVLKDLSKGVFIRARKTLVFLFAGLAFVYSLFFLDTRLNIWHSFGSDYSTHTAFAIAVSVAISVAVRSARWLIVVLFLYAMAMLYQAYHSILDIVTTSLVIGTPLMIARIRYARPVIKGVVNPDDLYDLSTRSREETQQKG